MFFLPLRWTERIGSCRANAMVVPTGGFACLRYFNCQLVSEGFINTIVNMVLEQVKVLPLCQDAQESKHLSALLGLVVGIFARLNISVPIEQELRKNTPLSNKIMTLLKAFVQPL